MAHNYEDIVGEWYIRLRPAFLNKLTATYPGLTLADAENLYQDAFIAVHENIQKGTVKENTSWRSYIMTIGMNLASKEWRKRGKSSSLDEESDDDLPSKTVRQATDVLKTLPADDAESELTTLEAKALLGKEIDNIKEPCKTIIVYYYYEKMKMEEIAEETGYRNAKTAKTKKHQCMKDLILRVKASLKKEGII